MRGDEAMADGELLRGEQIGNGIHRRDGDPEFLGAPIDLEHRLLGAPGTDHVPQIGVGIAPGLEFEVVRVVEQIGSVDEDEDVRLVGAAHPVHPAVAATEEVRAEPAQDLPGMCPGDGVPGVGGERRFLNGDIGVLSAARLVAFVQGGKRSDRGSLPGVELGLVAGKHQRWARRIAGEVHVAAHRPIDDRGGAPAGTRAVLPKGGYGDVDERGILLRDVHCAQYTLVGRGVAVDQHIRRGEEGRERVAAGRAREINGDAALVPVEVIEE